MLESIVSFARREGIIGYTLVQNGHGVQDKLQATLRGRVLAELSIVLHNLP